MQRSQCLKTKDLSLQSLVQLGKDSGINDITKREIKEYYENVVE